MNTLKCIFNEIKNVYTLINSNLNIILKQTFVSRCVIIPTIIFNIKSISILIKQLICYLQL